MHCLALVTDAFGGSGGIAQYNRDFLGALAASSSLSSIEVLPRHGRTGPDLPAGMAQRRPHRGRLRYSFAAAIAAYRRRPGLVFCGHVHMAPLAAVVARLCRAKLIVQAHGVEAWPARRGLRRRAVEAAALVLCVSRHTRARLLAWADLAPECAVVLPNTVADSFVPGDAGTLRAAWGLTGKRVLLTVGRLDPGERYKGHDRVIRVVPELVARGHDVAYLVVGEGQDRARLERLAEAAGVSGRVHFVGGVPPDRLAEAYRMADLYVMPSTGEGFGIVFLEAMACGTPALGLAVGGACDALADGGLGAAVLEEDLPGAIDRLLRLPRPDPEALAAETRARFGRDRFASRVALAVERACGAAA